MMTVQQAFDLALQHHQAGRLAEAEALYRQILAVEPGHAEALHLLGVIAQQVGRNDLAVELIRQAIVLRPNFSAAHSNLGVALRNEGRLDEAMAACRQALALEPDSPDACNNLGNALVDSERIDEAIASFRRAILLRPNFPEAHFNLGNTLRASGQLDAAIASYREAIALKPDYPTACNNLGDALKQIGRLDEAITAYRKAVALRLQYSDTQSNLLFALNYHPGLDPATVYEEHVRWNHQHAEPLRRFIQGHRNERSPKRRLRIGYVSPDFREHSVGRFLLPLLAQHDHEHFEIFCYAQVPAPDDMTRKIQAHGEHWQSLTGLADGPAAELIRQDQIDILVDLSGHTSHHRLLVFAHKPAPVQVTFLGYPNTTGLATIDYRLTDAYADPPGLTEPYHSEQLFRLPQCAWCYQPAASPPVRPREEGPITFGCFNNFAKVTEPMLLLWSRILHLVPGSRMLLKAGAFGSAKTQQRVREFLGAAGIDPERLELRGYEPDRDDHLALYRRLDVALDTFPYHGTKTTCEALWMGVPVVTLAGKTHASRVGVSLLTNIGLPELIARSPEEYVRLAAELAGDPPRLSHLRNTLRQRMEASPLMDAPRFARDIEAAYRAMWRKWCEETPP
jgi:predicted O-linked N-acetylglucosamine transferase (SPINDLY family)